MANLGLAGNTIYWTEIDEKKKQLSFSFTNALSKHNGLCFTVGRRDI